jgi:hypothetical protein
MQKKYTKKILRISVITLLCLSQAYVLAEPAVALTANDNVVVTLNVDEGITISDGANVTMAPNIGAGVNSSIGSSSWTVITNSANGYELEVKASASPALVSGGNSFADYTEATPGTPEVWSVGSSSKEFGYSAYGTDTSTSTWGTSASCGSSGSPAGSQKYVGFSTTDKQIATRASVTPTSGIATTICFAAAQNGVFAPAGTYTATITATATTL